MLFFDGQLRRDARAEHLAWRMEDQQAGSLLAESGKMPNLPPQAAVKK
jgi:hypothetical protein